MWKGTPPASGRATDPGDAEFEKSRDEALTTLRQMVARTRSEADRQASLERIHAAKYGGEHVEDVLITDMLARWEQFPRKRRPGAGHIKNVRAVVGRFVDYCRRYAPRAHAMDSVPAATVRGFLAAEEAHGISPRTYNRIVGTLRGIYRHLAPFSPAGRFLAELVMKDEDTRHREPFTAAELRRITAAAKQTDPLLHNLIICAATTAMRRGDVARLKWTSVDNPPGFLVVRTAKTGETTEIPVFPELRPILEEARRSAGTSPHVWPEAAALYAKRPDVLDRRLRKILAAVGFVDPRDQNHGEGDEHSLPVLPPDETRRRAVAALGKAPAWDTAHRKLVRTMLYRYLDGEGMKDVGTGLGMSISTVSLRLNEVERLAGCAIVRRRPAKAPSAEVAGFVVSEADPDHPRMRRASLRGWHSFRTTWITLALDAGVPMELVRKVTGHTAAEVVLKHYFRPGRESFRAALQSALPAGLIGRATEPEKPRVMIDLEEACRIVEGAKTLEEVRVALRAMGKTGN